MIIPSLSIDILNAPTGTLTEIPVPENESTPSFISVVNLISNSIVTGDPIEETLVPVAGLLTLSDLPINGSLSVFKNGQRITVGEDYSYLAGVITLLVEADPLDVYVVTYQKQP